MKFKLWLGALEKKKTKLYQKIDYIYLMLIIINHFMKFTLIYN